MSAMIAISSTNNNDNNNNNNNNDNNNNVNINHDSVNFAQMGMINMMMSKRRKRSRFMKSAIDRNLFHICCQLENRRTKLRSLSTIALALLK